MFGTSLDVEISCLDPQCGETLVAQFEGGKESEDCQSNCRECGHAYNVVRNDWSDTPEDEVSWNVYA